MGENMSKEALYKLGIDIGSTTVKIAILSPASADEQSSVLFADEHSLLFALCKYP